MYPECFRLYGKGEVLDYEGKLSGGAPNGEGVLTIKRNHQIIYEGGFRDGFFHGKGTLFDKGFIIVTDWQYGMATGKAVITTPHGIIVTANVDDGKINLGACSVRVPNGNRSFFGSYNLDEGTDGMFTTYGTFYSGQHDVTDQVLNDPSLVYIKKVPHKPVSEMIYLNQDSILRPVIKIENELGERLGYAQIANLQQFEKPALAKLREIREKLYLTDSERVESTVESVLKEIDYYLAQIDKHSDNTM